MTMLTVTDLFAGAGGLSLGFSRAGFRVLEAWDLWHPAVETYRANLGDHIHEESITRELQLSGTNVIVGGPPCQGFSSAGLRHPADDRNTLVAEFSALIAQHCPDAFVFENVEGFLTARDGDFVFELLEPLIDAGYRIHLRKINAANYGVPQHRKRVIAIGGLGWDPPFPEPTHAAFGAPGAYLNNGRATIQAPSLSEAIAKLPPATRDSNENVLDHWFTPLSGDDLKRAQALKSGQRMCDLPEELWHQSYRKRAFRRVMDGTPSERRGGAPAGIRRLSGEEPSKAITGGATRDFLHPVEDRPLTIRECAVLQTFPVNFHFHGTQSERIQLIGNAVPPLLAERIAIALRDAFAHRTYGRLEGALLSFVPTPSIGMSPILADVTDRILAEFAGKATTGFTEALWH